MDIGKLFIYKKNNIYFLSKNKNYDIENHHTIYYVIWDIYINSENYDKIYVKNYKEKCKIEKNNMIEDYDFFFFSPKIRENNFICINILNKNDTDKIEKIHEFNDWKLKDFFFIYKDYLIDTNIKFIENNLYKSLKNPKISIIMTHFERAIQLKYTLYTIQQSILKDNIEVIIVDDGSSLKCIEEINKFIFSFGIPINLILLKSEYKKEKNYFNPCIGYNIGFNVARGEKCIIQNSECCHYLDLSKYVDENLKENDYYTFSCFSLSLKNTLNVFRNPQINLFDFVSNVHTEKDFRNQWFNHHLFRRSNYHFTSAIYRKDLIKIGGFHEGFFNKIAFDDDEFLDRINYHKLNIKLIEFNKKLPFSVHLYHNIVYNGKGIPTNGEEYDSIRKIKDFNFNNYKYL